MIYAYVKRFLDVLLSVFLLIFLSWLYASISLCFVVFRNYPVLFYQQRIGYQNKPFLIYKFRTLKVDSSHKLQNRRFPFGNFLRRTSIDELPQLWNVLKGDMSLIGPRPLPIEYLNRFSSEQLRRHNVRPGITGLAQVNGRNSLTWEEKFKFDIYYVNNVSLLLDFQILMKTIVLLFSFRKDVSLDEPEFLG
jgi:lipopolysaccharide/colanic/teichoic acid biosynthesis glycosyltransferase